MTESPEHEFEAAPGLPEPLPSGERLLWQGAPELRALCERVFHVRTVALYFAVILFARAATVWAQGGSAAAGIVAAAWLLPAVVFALALLVGLAALTSRTTVYTITDRRVVMRVGIVLSVTFNLPFSRIESAAVKPASAGSGDIALALEGPDRIAYLHLWPHARPWRLKRTEPMLRCVADAAMVGRVLAQAWATARGLPQAGAAPAPTTTAPRPAARPGARHGTALAS